jgi:acetolactate synthase-1/2/3 large subunit
MEIQTMARYGQTFGTNMGAVRWDIVAQGLGCHGELVQTIAELPAALQRAHGQDRSAVICVHTSVEANLAVPQDIVARFFEVYFGPST